MHGLTGKDRGGRGGLGGRLGGGAEMREEGAAGKVNPARLPEYRVGREGEAEPVQRRGEDVQQGGGAAAEHSGAGHDRAGHLSSLRPWEAGWRGELTRSGSRTPPLYRLVRPG